MPKQAVFNRLYSNGQKELKKLLVLQEDLKSQLVLSMKLGVES